MQLEAYPLQVMVGCIPNRQGGYISTDFLKFTPQR